MGNACFGKQKQKQLPATENDGHKIIENKAQGCLLYLFIELVDYHLSTLILQDLVICKICYKFTLFDQFKYT